MSKQKSAKSNIFFVLILLFTITVFVLLSVGVKLKNEQVMLKIDESEKILKTERQKKIKLTADYQTVTGEERIISIASRELGLVNKMNNPIILEYEKDQLEKAEDYLKEKYE